MNKPTIFISHISQEKEIARVVKEFLEKKFLKAINVFSSSHEESLQLGDDWMSTIKKSMYDCKLILILCSPISITRPWINFEAGAGWIKNIPVIPLCHSGLLPSKLPVPLNSFQGGVLTNQEDIIKVFNRIAKIVEMDLPELKDDSFFTAIESFELEIINSNLVQDSTFVHNFLYSHIDTLKYCIYASVSSYEKLNEYGSKYNSLKDLEFNFNDTYNLFNRIILMKYSQKKEVFQLYYETVHQIVEDIKFILTYNSIEIAPSLREMFYKFLFSVILVDVWHDGIELLNVPHKVEIREMCIRLIKDEPLPPCKKDSNVINYYIDYYESLIYFQKWLIEYETEIDNLMQRGDIPLQ